MRPVQVNWPRVREVLCPQFDIGYAALIEDLHARGLLDETLVVVMGEFGRSPTINKNGGRDYWGNVFLKLAVNSVRQLDGDRFMKGE